MNLPTTQTPVKRQDIVEAARKLLDVRWKHQGRNPEIGLDCAGMVVTVGKQLGLTTYDSCNYHRNPLSDEFVKHFSENMTRKRLLDRKEGDVLLFRDKMFSCHSAIVSKKHGVEHIIHAYAKHKKIVEEPLTGEWLDRMTYCFEFEGVSD